VCGLLLLAGLAARLAALPLIVTMIVAILTAKLGDVEGVSDLFGLQEMDYVVLAVTVAVLGAGPLSLDRLLALLGARRRDKEPQRPASLNT
jgi:putative oxidoreductase